MPNYLVCEICFSAIARFDPGHLHQPLDGTMFTSPRPRREVPAPFSLSADVDWENMRCPVCHRRPIIKPGRIMTHHPRCFETECREPAYYVVPLEAPVGEVVEQLGPFVVDPINCAGHIWLRDVDWGDDHYICKVCGQRGVKIDGEFDELTEEEFKAFQASKTAETDSTTAPSTDDQTEVNTVAPTENEEKQPLGVAGSALVFDGDIGAGIPDAVTDEDPKAQTEDAMSMYETYVPDPEDADQDQPTGGPDGGASETLEALNTATEGNGGEEIRMPLTEEPEPDDGLWETTQPDQTSPKEEPEPELGTKPFKRNYEDGSVTCRNCGKQYSSEETFTRYHAGKCPKA